MTAAEFSTAINYSVGDLVLHNGVLYRFIAYHAAGAWNDSHAEAVDGDIEQQLQRILTGYDNAEKAAAFADTLVFEPELVGTDQYRYIFTNAPDPRN